MSLYGWVLAASVILAGGLTALRLPASKRYAAPLMTGLCVLLGLVMARLVFWLCSVSVFMGQRNDFASLLRVNEGGLSMTGALLGAGLGCLLTARIIRDPELRFPVLADALAPGAALFVACERCHEWPLLHQNYGYDMAEIPFLTVENHYSFVMDTARISSLAALAILAAVLFMRPKKPGDRALAFVFLYGLTQILLESLRQDQHMMWDFVRAQQLFAFLAAFGVVMVLGVRARRPWSAFLASLVTVGCIIALEFALEGRIHAPFAFMRENLKESWYIVFILVLAGYLAYACRLSGKYGKDR